MNTAPYLLLEIKTVFEILNLWGRRVGKMCTYLFFVLSPPLFPDCRRLSPHVLWWAYHWGICVMVDCAVMGTSFTICHHFVTHVLLLFPPPHCSQEKYSELWHWKKKKKIHKQWRECAQEDIVENCRKHAYIDLEDVVNFPKHPSTNHKNSKILIV